MSNISLYRRTPGSIFLAASIHLLAACTSESPKGEDAAPADVQPFIAADSISVPALSDNLLHAVSIGSDSFAIASYPDEPVCFAALATKSQNCVRVQGGGPAEVLGVEQMVAWPPSSVALWDRQSGRVGVWSANGRPDTTVKVSIASAQGYDLTGVLSDSSVVVAQSPAFHEMPLGVFAVPESLFLANETSRVPLKLNPQLGHWTSVVPVNEMRSGLSIPSYAESFAVVVRSGLVTIDARACSIVGMNSRPHKLPKALCRSTSGFRDAVFRYLDSTTVPNAATHRAFASKSEIPEHYTTVVDVLVSYQTSEIAVRRRKLKDETFAYWSIIDPTGREIEALSVPEAYKLIGFSRSYLLAANVSDDPSATWLSFAHRNK